MLTRSLLTRRSFIVTHHDKYVRDKNKKIKAFFLFNNSLF